MPQSTNIASNRIYLERLGHFVPNLSQSNSSLGPGYAVGIKAKTGTIRKINYIGGLGRGKGRWTIRKLLPFPDFCSACFACHLFFCACRFFSPFSPNAWPGPRLVKFRWVKLHVPCCFAKPVISHEKTYLSNVPSVSRDQLLRILLNKLWQEPREFSAGVSMVLHCLVALFVFPILHKISCNVGHHNCALDLIVLTFKRLLSFLSVIWVLVRMNKKWQLYYKDHKGLNEK